MRFAEINAEVEANGGVLTVSMEKLRDSAGFGKLGVHVVKQIHNLLEGAGLGHIPKLLPTDQSEQVRLYKQGTPIAHLIHAVLAPGYENDQRLKNYVVDGDSGADEILERIRELLSE